MRLSEFQIEIINKLAKKYFGPMATVYLFGSRTDENKKGGDIDLFISNDDENILTIEAKVRFLAELKRNIGDRKIDVVFDNANCREKKTFYHSITQNKVKL
ncbi:MAG: nucleotidyltransferase domain-containing protein [Bacteroidales bacterium]|nr:nucleotidyltransferase domain-containing protein [Bacteroidales bacterium]